MKEATSKERCKKRLHFFALWSVPIFTLIGTLFLGFESFESEKKDARHDREYRDVTNQLGHTESKYNEATNDLAAAQKAAQEAQSAAKTAMEAAKPKSLNERLVGILNSIDKTIVLRMAKSSNSVPFFGDMEQTKYVQLKQIASESNAWRYLQISDPPRQIVLIDTGEWMALGVRFWIYPALLKKE